MYIEDRLFSENSEEVLYSILMDEEEYDLFSEFREKIFSKRKSKKESDSDSKSIGVGAGVYAAGVAGNTAAGVGYKVNSKKAQSQEITSKLLDRAKSGDVKVDTTTSTGRGPLYSPSKNTVFTDGSKSAGSLSHELGHSDYLRKGGKGGKIGKASHKAYMLTGGSLNPIVLQPAAAIGAGIASGKRAAELEEEGKKQSKLGRHAGWIAPVALSAPVLVSEGLASRRGYKMLKESGASKELLKNAKKELGSAWGTYAGAAAANAGLGELSRGIAYNIRKSNIKEEKKEKKRKK